MRRRLKSLPWRWIHGEPGQTPSDAYQQLCISQAEKICLQEMVQLPHLSEVGYA
jgi:hypothetical protein